ncbi:MAG: hypothetical protein ONB43_25485 [candidate division KSB1 bacterium]|nr:hypothetical protein [candidate division KSB1 bacterium]MDZ7407174.1 hypothetical protein [candidate division KSB1 bacterium]
MYGADNREALRFTIALEKNTYFIDEAIYLEMLATNISNREVGISDMTYNASSGHFRIILKDEHDQLVDYHGGEAHIVGYPDSWSGLIMSPGESWLQVVDLLSIFGKWGDAAHQIRLFLPPGVYKVQVIYDTSPKVLIAKNRAPEDRQTLYSNICIPSVNPVLHRGVK